jgi:hypothetical protein
MDFTIKMTIFIFALMIAIVVGAKWVSDDTYGGDPPVTAIYTESVDGGGPKP